MCVAYWNKWLLFSIDVLQAQKSGRAKYIALWVYLTHHNTLKTLSDEVQVYPNPNLFRAPNPIPDMPEMKALKQEEEK